MKNLLIISFLLLLGLNGFGQEIKKLAPGVSELNLSLKGEKEFKENLSKCDAIWEKMNEKLTYDKLPQKEKDILDNCDETVDDYWSIIGVGCSWYCGGGPKAITASSYLISSDTNDYQPQNAHDLSYNSAWVEGVKGYGVGEYLLYHFSAQSPRITTITVVNGYVKNETVWKNNSRVKKIKMYIDNKPYAILNLTDQRSEQSFSVPPIGNDVEDWDKLENAPDWTIKFEILDVYKGDKYDDTVISEIYFDGIDVH